MWLCFCSELARTFMASSLTIRFRRFPYLVIGWALLAGLSLLAPDRMFLTHQQGLWLGLAFVGVALLRGAGQVGRDLPAEIGVLELSRLPHQNQMQYVGHGFSWDTQRANEVLAAERGTEAVIFIDPKGDLSVLHRAYDAAVRAGRQKDFQFFSLAYPHLSCTYNPLHNFVLGMEMPDRLSGLLPGGGQSEPFKAFAWEVINVIAQAMLLAGERPLLSKIARYAKVNRSLEELLPKVPEHTPEFEYLQALIKHPPDHYDKMVSSLKPMLSKLDTPDFRNLMSVTTPQLDWDRAVRLKKIVYMFMGSMIVKETAYAIGMLALQDLLNFIGRAYAYEPTKTPIRLIVDEVGRLAFPGFVDLLSQAGGQGLMAVLAFQSVADLVSVLGPAGAQQILDNTNTKLWFRATDHATAKTFADIAGQGPLLTRRESAAYRPVVPGKPGRNRLAFDATFAQQSTEVVENLVREDWLMKLPRGQAFLYASGQTYKTRFPLMPEPKNRFPLEAAP